jgi:hypothetical protein
MSLPDLESLLAPTWKERARADDALMGWLLAQGDSTGPWPDAVQQQVRALAPSPEIFLRALVGFWADVVARQFQARLRKVDDAWTSHRDATHADVFPMEPAQAPPSENMMRGMWVWKFLERLGPGAAFVEAPLVDCLYHPEPLVWNAAELALGGAPALGDASFACFLDMADRRGRNGILRQRSGAIARHVDVRRVRALFAGLAPQAPTDLQIARFAILGRLAGDAAAAALPPLAALLRQAWNSPGHGALLRAINELSATVRVDPAVPVAMRTLATHGDPEVRGAAAAFLARHGEEGDGPLLFAFADDPDPWVRVDLCRALIERGRVDPELARVVIAKSLGEDEDCDGEPQHSAIALVRHDPVAALESLPAIARWWNAATTGDYMERGTIRQGMRVVEALAPHTDAQAWLPGVERALAWLTAPDDEVELPSLADPGAVPVIRDHLEQSMLEAGGDPAQAAAVADQHAAMLAEFAANLDRMQADIDAQQARWDAEQRELHPERFVDADDDANDADEEPFIPQEDELVVDLRALKTRLAGSRDAGTSPAPSRPA